MRVVFIDACGKDPACIVGEVVGEQSLASLLSYQAESAHCGSLHYGHSDAVLLDVSHSQDPFTVLSEVLLSCGARPVVMLGRRSTHSSVLEALSRGAEEYLARGEDTPQILAALRRAVSRRAGISLRAATAAQFEPLPVCSCCKSVRSRGGAWRSIEAVLERFTQRRITHSLCPSCVGRLYPGLLPEDNKRQQPS